MAEKSHFLKKIQKSKLEVLFASLRPIFVPNCKGIEETGEKK